MKDISRTIQKEIIVYQNAEKAEWLENYIKHDIRSLGVGIPQIRRIVININKKCRINEESITNQIILLDDLMQSQYTEFKLAAI